MNRAIIFISLIILGVYGIIAANSIGRPLVADEWMNRSAAESIVLIGKPQLFGLLSRPSQKNMLSEHPSLYLYLLVFFFNLFGIGDIQARFVGVVFFILSFILVYFMSKNLYPKNKLAPLVALILFGLSPIAVQGSLMIDIDQTLLTFSATLFLYCFIKFDEWPTKKKILGLSLVFFFVICSKLSLPPILILSTAIYYSLKKRLIKGMLEILGIFFIGGGLFLLSWWLYCYSLNFMDYFFKPFSYIVEVFFKLQAKGNLLQKFIEVSINLFRISLWTSPFLLLLGVYVMGKQTMIILKDKVVPKDFILSIFVFITLIGYLFVCGLSHGFPKTQLPMMPALAVLIGGNISWNFNRKRSLFKLAIIFVSALLFLLIVVGDVIYIVNYAVKESFIYNYKLSFKSMILPLLLYIVSPFLVLGVIHIVFYPWRFVYKFLYGISKFHTTGGARGGAGTPSRGNSEAMRRIGALRSTIGAKPLWNKLRAKRGNLLMAMVITTLAANLSLDILQAKADYLTTADYGGRGKGQLIYFLKSILRQDDIVFSTSEIIYDVKSRKSTAPSQQVWGNPKEFLRFVKEKEPRAIVYGIPLNTVEQFKKTLHNPQILEWLKRNYKRKDIGSYTVWFKDKD